MTCTCLIRELAHRLPLDAELLTLRAQNHLLAFSFGYPCTRMNTLSDESIALGVGSRVMLRVQVLLRLRGHSGAELRAHWSLRLRV